MFVVGLFIVPFAEFYFFSSDRLNCAASIVRLRYYTNQIVFLYFVFYFHSIL